MVTNLPTRFVYAAALLAWGLWPAALSAQMGSTQPLDRPVPNMYGRHDNRGYAVGPGDVLTVTFRGEPSLTGRFTVETDRTFVYHHIGSLRAAGLTVPEIETELRNRLIAGEFFEDPQVTVTMAQYRNQQSRNLRDRGQKIFVVGAVRTPGQYILSGNMRLRAALALAGSTLPTAADEAVIVPAGNGNPMISASAEASRRSLKARDRNTTPVTRVNLSQMRNGASLQNVVLRDGDTVFVLRAGNIYVAGQVIRNQGTYARR